jgi:hypothetical protein
LEVGGHGEEVAQTMYTHMNKYLKSFKKRKRLTTDLWERATL